MDEARGCVEIATGVSGPTHHFAPPRLPTYLPGRSLRELCDRGAAPATPRLPRPLSPGDGPLLGRAAVPGLLKVTRNHRRGKKKMKG